MAEIRQLADGDRQQWLRLRQQLHPDDPVEMHAAEMTDILGDPLQAAYGAYEGDDLLGIVEVGERPWGEGCETMPVAWIENLIVAEAARRRGIARELIEAAAAWARSRGLDELGSDVNVGNEPSLAGHLTWGFEETMRLVMFRRRL